MDEALGAHLVLPKYTIRGVFLVFRRHDGCDADSAFRVAYGRAAADVHARADGLRGAVPAGVPGQPAGGGGGRGSACPALAVGPRLHARDWTRRRRLPQCARV